MDATIRLIYGPNPPTKSADLNHAISIAHEDLLLRKVLLPNVRQRAKDLFAGPMPYSTHDLAVSTALAFFKDSDWLEALAECQMPARMLVLNWVQAGKVVRMLAQVFEKDLYERYHPRNRPSPPPAADDFVALASQIMMLQVVGSYESPAELLPDVTSSALATGYVFGFHDAYFRLSAKVPPEDVPTEIAQAYMTTFGRREGFDLYQTSMRMQEEKEFYVGRVSGGEDYASFVMKKVPPLGLSGILVQGFDVEAVMRTLDFKAK